MSGITDLHCHILPGIDDGAKTLTDTENLLRDSAVKGIDRIVFTPHYYPERVSLEQFLANRESAVQVMAPVAQQLGIQFRVGAEIQITPILASLPLERLAFSGTKYLLLELLTMYQPHDVTGLIERLCDKGYIPILAHVERFPYIEEDPTLLYKWVKAGALGQVNAGWLLHDKHAMKRLRKYFDWNLVHVMASDTHSMEHRPQQLDRGLKLLPEEMARELQQNASMIFEGNEINKKNPVKPRHSWGAWR